jgi:hypothetical protein
LICGDTRSGYVDSVGCDKGCGYGVHDYCLSVLRKVVVALGKHTPSSSFYCTHVLYQFKPEEIAECLNFVNGRLVRERRNRGHRWSFVESSVRALVNVSKRRGPVKISSYSLRQQRWENEDSFCNLCKRWVGIDETDHFESWCTGIGATPTTSSDSVYIRSRCKRFRHMIRGANVV